MRKFIYAIATSFCVLGFVSASSASAATLYSSVAADCELDTSSTATAAFSGADGSVTFSGSSTGLIRLTCRVTPFSFSGCPSSSALYMTAADGDGGGGWDNYYVSTWLNSIPKGSSTTVTNLANVESTSSTKAEVSEASSTFANTGVNFATNYIWVSVDIYRLNTTNNPKFWGFTIYC